MESCRVLSGFVVSDIKSPWLILPEYSSSKLTPPKTQLGTAKTNSGQHSDSAKNSESGTPEHNENDTERTNEAQTQTNSGEFETKMAISQKFLGEQESALSKAVIHLQEKHLGVTVKNIQTYFMMNNTEISDRL